MKKSWRHIAIALSGVLQSCEQVEQLAKTGYLKTNVLETAVFSLLEQSPVSTEAIYQDITRLRGGVETLLALLEHHRDPQNADILRYVLSVFHLQKKLAAKSDVLYIIGNRLEKVQHQVDHFGLTHDNVISNVADIYTDTISKFQYRIQVTGEYGYLQQQRVANQIRVLLLSAIRSATLWRQSGGSRWHLLVYRERIANAARELLEEINREEFKREQQNSAV